MGIPQQPFSTRFQARPVRQPRNPNDVPESAKRKLVSLIARLKDGALPGAYSLGPRLADALGKPFEAMGDMPKVRALITGLEWWEFYDASEELLRMAKSPEIVADALEALFAEEGLPYRITTAGIEYRFPEPTAEAIGEADRVLLADPKYRGPGEQWEKAKSFLNARPPDAENAIKDALGALEGVTRLIARKPQETLSQIIGPLAKSLNIHGALAKAIGDCYAFRGDQQGIAHGATQAFEDQTAEAELLLHWTAAAITYLVRKKAP